MNRTSPAFIIITILSLLLLNNLILASSNKIKKEIKVYDTFENYKIDKPFKVYQSEKEYNLDGNIKNDPTYIKKIITTDELNPSKSYCNEIVPNFYLKQYEEFTGLNNRNAKNLKKLIVLYDSVEKMQKYKAVKLYKSDNCERELEQDMRTIFKGREDLIKIVYRYNKFNKIIFYQEHRIPACHLEKYLDLKVSSGKISTFEAYEITKRGGNEKCIWYDHNKNYIREKRIKNSKSSNSNTDENVLKHRRSKTKPGRFHDIQPPPFLGSIEEQNRYLTEKIIADYNKMAKDKIISPYDDSMLTHVGYFNNRKRRNSVFKGFGHFSSAPTGLSVPIPKTDIPNPTSKESVMSLIPTSNMQAYNLNVPNSTDSTK